ncbi:MAG: FAD-binding oxidoreductase, partial [Eubacterium sp.]
MTAANIQSLDIRRFGMMKPMREKMIVEAAADPIPPAFPVNELSKALHPDVQHVKIGSIKEWDKDCKTYTFVPDPSRGTDQIAFFKAGAYLSIFLDIDGVKLTRPYSICSSPREALEGSISITVKLVKGGFVSPYILENWKVGDPVDISGPLGEFGYIPVRDAKTVIALAGGSGITPFRSLAKAIAEGNEDFRMILLYGSRTEENILFREDFDEIQAETNKVKVVHVLSDEDKPGFEHGFLSAELIQKYAPKDEPYSIFLCGPGAMYNFVDKEIEKLHLERKWIRHELQGEFHNPKEAPDYPQKAVPETVSICVTINGETKEIQARSSDSVLQSLERNGIAAPSRCRSGECG